jgi:hypothetical protein
MSADPRGNCGWFKTFVEAVAKEKIINIKSGLSPKRKQVFHRHRNGCDDCDRRYSIWLNIFKRQVESGRVRSTSKDRRMLAPAG